MRFILILNVNVMQMLLNKISAGQEKLSKQLRPCLKNQID